MVKTDPRSHIPIYLQIVDGIRVAVAAGVYLPGESIPTLKAMSLEARVNPNTVQKAYDELAREGVIYSQRGKGLFVAEKGKAADPGQRQHVDAVADPARLHQQDRAPAAEMRPGGERDAFLLGGQHDRFDVRIGGTSAAGRAR